MGLLAGASFVLATWSNIDQKYYQVVSVFSSAFPIIWSQILDACKTYESELTPARNTPSSIGEVVREDLQDHANLHSMKGEHQQDHANLHSMEVEHQQDVQQEDELQVVE